MTAEERVSFGLLEYFQKRPGVVIVLSWHSPAAKAYAGQLIRIPRKLDDKVTRERYHLDFIVLVGNLLVLQELKGAASELGEDIHKLRALVRQYPLKELRMLLARRIPDLASKLAETTEVVLSVGCEILDRALPDDLLCFLVDGQGVEVRVGRGLPDNVRQVLESALLSPPAS